MTLVAAPGETGWADGLGRLEDLAVAAHAVGSGDWVAGGLSGLSAGVEALGEISDPFGALVAAGFGWAIEHFEPFRGWLDDLTGDPAQVRAFATTWRNVADRVAACADDVRGEAERVTSAWEGASADAYVTRAARQARVVDVHAVVLVGVAGATEGAAALVGAVRDLVRDAISQLVGYGISKLAQALTGVLAPKALAELALKVAEWASRIAEFLRMLLASLGRLGEHLDTLLDALAGVAGLVEGLAG